jgi:lysine-ketoglutarate reductase/saccharopine dehydrogenase-like protein (TIGR00300 family)
VAKDGVAPDNYHGTSIFPEYFKIDGSWVLLKESRMDCAVVIKENGDLEAKEFRRLEAGEKVILGRSEDSREGIFVYPNGFKNNVDNDESFAFRSGRTRETAYSKDYDKLYDILRNERDNGYIIWVLGPAVVFDSNSRKAMMALIENGFVDAVFAGNALATHDIEGEIFKTALGQGIYSQVSMPNGHYHHLDIINGVRGAGSLRNYIESNSITGGVIHACMKNNIPVILAGSIRDDGPLPDVIADVYSAQNEMRKHTKKATMVLGLATQLHSIATGNMTPSYQVINDEVRPVYIYSVDVSEFAVNKLRDRGTLEVTSIVTNIQDFLVNLERNLVPKPYAACKSV